MQYYQNLLTIELETSQDQGQDASLFMSYGESLLIAVFDGMGGRSGMIGGEHGARVASRYASLATRKFFQDIEVRGQKLDDTNLISLQRNIEHYLRIIKQQSEKNSVKQSRVKGFKNTLQNDKLATTLALVSISQSEENPDTTDLDLAWMGDSRIYFLSSQKGLQQLTKDDLEEYKDAFESVFAAGSPMSQYLTPNMSTEGAINFKHVQIQEPGLVIACTDGAFDGLYPWQFEFTLLYFLHKSNSFREWQQQLINNYQGRKVGDDVTLLLFPLGFGDGFNQLKILCNNDRYNYLSEYFDTNKNRQNLEKIWDDYRTNYEERINQTSLFTDSIVQPIINPVVVQKLSSLKQGIESGGHIQPDPDGADLRSNTINPDSNSSPELLHPQTEGTPTQNPLATATNPQIDSNQSHSPQASYSSDSASESNQDLKVTAKAENRQDFRRVTFDLIQKSLDNKQYDQAIKVSLEILERDEEDIPALSYLMLALVTKENNQTIKLFSGNKNSKTHEKASSTFVNICGLIDAQELLKDDSDNAFFSLGKFIQSLSQLETVDLTKINIDANTNLILINSVCTRLSIKSNQNRDNIIPYIMVLRAKILDLERKKNNLAKEEFQQKSEEIKSYLERALKLYEEQGNQNRAYECKQQLNQLKNILNRDLWVKKNLNKNQRR